MSDSTDGVYEKLVDAIKAHAELDNEDIVEAGRHGADAGWAGFTWNQDAADFYDQNEDLIWRVLEEMAGACGYENPMAMVAAFKRSDMLDSAEGFKVLLAWFALEEAGRYLDA